MFFTFEGVLFQKTFLDLLFNLTNINVTHIQHGLNDILYSTNIDK